MKARTSPPPRIVEAMVMAGFTALAFGAIFWISVGAQPLPPPIIDMHLHAVPADSQGPPPLGLCPGQVDTLPPFASGQPWPQTFMAHLKKPPCAAPVWSPTSDREIMERTFAVMTRRNVYGVVSGRFTLDWQRALPGRVIPSLAFTLGSRDAASPADVRAALASGSYRAFGEVANQYNGYEPSDPAFDPYLAILEELDIPMAIHVGTGPPGAPYLGYPKYRARLHSPLAIEEALVKHPRLHVSLMHAGWPMLDDLLAALWTHPQVYVDLGVISFALPRPAFHDYLRRIVDAGFGKRVMFGSDQMVWPEVIEAAIAGVEQAAFLTDEQRRDILYNNAARFLRLSAQEIARHHGR
jgi:predicted TIM-barrel fold metal-dependent hydrolase